MHFPMLYSRTSSGQVNTWQVFVDNDSFYIVEGLLNGQRTQSSPVSCEPKNTGKANATTAEEQAYKEAEARFKKKLKSGYKENIEDIDIKDFIKPMLAKNYKDYSSKINFAQEKWVLQCKFNGVRCIATKDGLYSRTGEKYITPKHIEDKLKPFFEKYPDAFLDGELFNEMYRQSLNELIKLVRKTVNISSDDYNDAEQMVKYYVYDGMMSENDQLGYTDRITNIYHELSELNITTKDDYGSLDSNSPVIEVESFNIASEDDAHEIYDNLVSDGHEGAMLRLAASKYEFKRSKNLLKLKPEDDDEAVIIDINRGNGDWYDTGKIIQLKWKDKVFSATFKGTIEQGKDFLNNKDKWIGKQVTFLYNGLTGLGVPNYARVDINNCIKSTSNQF